MKKNIYIPVFCFSIFLLSCASPAWLKENRALLKEYAFSSCLEYATKDTVLFSNDISQGAYRDISNYDIEVYKIIDSLAERVAAEMKPSIIAL